MRWRWHSTVLAFTNILTSLLGRTVSFILYLLVKWDIPQYPAETFPTSAKNNVGLSKNKKIHKRNIFGGKSLRGGNVACFPLVITWYQKEKRGVESLKWMHYVKLRHVSRKNKWAVMGGVSPLLRACYRRGRSTAYFPRSVFPETRLFFWVNRLSNMIEPAICVIFPQPTAAYVLFWLDSFILTYFFTRLPVS